MTKEEFFAGFDSNDLETQRILESSWNKTISIQELNRGSTLNGNNPFEEVSTNKAFEEISNEIATNTPFGKESIFYRKLREIITGQIPKL